MAELKTLIPHHEIESGAWDQIKYLQSLNFVEKIVILPDVHKGFLMPVGSVALMNNVISPEGVGVDIGCGMLFHKTPLKIRDIIEDRQQILDEVYRVVPTGFQSRTTPKSVKKFTTLRGYKNYEDSVNSKMQQQIGTLGGGNHFIEIGYIEDNSIAVVIHSGSRNPGKQVADFWFEVSKVQDAHIPPGFLNLSGYGQMYLREMNQMIDFALANRMEMLKAVCGVLGLSYTLEVGVNVVNETHNHAIVTPEGVLHRKGATPAEEGQIGVIPGNMRDGTYITRGLGNPEYLCSASHGAGRKMSRNQAKKACTLEKFESDMRGIYARVSESTLDEAPDAYKSLSEVIERQDGIVVEVIDKVTPLINIKG